MYGRMTTGPETGADDAAADEHHKEMNGREMGRGEGGVRHFRAAVGLDLGEVVCVARVVNCESVSQRDLLYGRCRWRCMRRHRSSPQNVVLSGRAKFGL
jgi:hypothetical protein